MRDYNKYKQKEDRTKYKLSDYAALVAIMGMLFLFVMCSIPIASHWMALIKEYWTL